MIQVCICSTPVGEHFLKTWNSSSSVSNCAKDSDALEHNVFIHSIFQEEYNVWQLQMTNRCIKNVLL